MRILFLTWKDIHHPKKGGAEMVMYHYARELVLLGHEVVWFASAFQGAEKEEVLDGIRIIRKYSMHTVWMFAWKWYKSFREKEEIDIIIDEAGGWPLLAPFFEKRIPIIFFAHHIGDAEFASIVGKLARVLYRWMIRQYKSIPTITVSDSTKHELIEDFGFDSQSITVIENACDIVPVDQVDFREKENRILFLGRLMPIKRVEDAIRAFRVLVHDTRFADYTLDIIGNNQDRIYQRTLEKIVVECSLEGKVVFHGNIERTLFDEFVRREKIILVPSKKEGFGLVVLEANSYGIPAIGYDVGGLRDSIVEGENGFLIPDGDFEAMGQKLIELLSDVPLFEKMSMTSLEHAKSHGTWRENTKILEKILTKISR